MTQSNFTESLDRSNKQYYYLSLFNLPLTPRASVADDLAGVDFTMDGLRIDVKQSQFYRQTTCLELHQWNKGGGIGGKAGWFLDPSKKTDTYIFMDGDIAQNTSGVIPRLDLFMVSRQALRNKVAEYKTELAEAIKDLYTIRKSLDSQYPTKATKKYKIAPGIGLTYNNLTWDGFKPVLVLVVSKDILRQLATYKNTLYNVPII